MRYIIYAFACAASLLFMAGCGTAVSSHWRDNARGRFNTALSAGVDQFAPEETDNIRQTMALADRYFATNMIEDADRLYQLSCQKSQLLYRNLVVSLVKEGTTLVASSDDSEQPSQTLVVAPDVVSLKDVLHSEEADPKPDNSSKTTPSRGIPQTYPIQPTRTVQTVGTTTSNYTSAPGKPAVAKEMRDSLQLPGNRGKNKIIYLTFDDGPSRLTLPIASFLNSQSVSATFFALGSNIKGHEKAITTLVAMGHRVGNHTLSHNLKKLNASFRNEVSEVKRTAQMIDRLGGDGSMVRIPYGASNRSLISHVASEGAQIFDWDINSNDTTRRGVNDHHFIEKTVLSYLNGMQKKHIIILFHDGAGHNSTLTALKNLIPRLKQDGYRFGLLHRNEKVAVSHYMHRAMP